mgnify:CR=1 FL=1
MRIFSIIITTFCILVASPAWAEEVKVYPGPEDSAYQVTQSEDLSIRSSDGKIYMLVKIRGAQKKDSAMCLKQVIGKEANLHSRYLNVVGSDGSDKSVISKQGIATFVFSNPSVKVADGEAFPERFWLTVNDAWGFIPETPYTRKDEKGNPGLEFVFHGEKIYAVPKDWYRDGPKFSELSPKEMYGENFQKTKKSNY